MVDREIERESPQIPAPKEDFAKNDGKESAEDRSKLPELPSLDDMEPDPERPRSVSVAASTKSKEKTDPSSRLQDKLDQVEESFTPKEETKKTKETIFERRPNLRRSGHHFLHKTTESRYKRLCKTN